MVGIWPGWLVLLLSQNQLKCALVFLCILQLLNKDPERSIALFWAAIIAGDKVDSALKDMANVLKQQNRSEEAIEAIISLRNRCSVHAQESLDNILLELYKVNCMG